jgi:hypothetical protein
MTRELPADRLSVSALHPLPKGRDDLVLLDILQPSASLAQVTRSPVQSAIRPSAQEFPQHAPWDATRRTGLLASRKQAHRQMPWAAPRTVPLAPWELRMARVRRFLIGVVVHLGHDEPRAICLALQNTQGVVVPHLDLTSADKLLPFDLQRAFTSRISGVSTRKLVSGGAFTVPALKLSSANKPRRYSTISPAPRLTLPKH